MRDMNWLRALLATLAATIAYCVLGFASGPLLAASCRVAIVPSGFPMSAVRSDVRRVDVCNIGSTSAIDEEPVTLSGCRGRFFRRPSLVLPIGLIYRLRTTGRHKGHEIIPLLGKVAPADAAAPQTIAHDQRGAVAL